MKLCGYGLTDGSWVMHNGSLSVWVTGSWVTASDPLPALEMLPDEVILERRNGPHPLSQPRRRRLLTCFGVTWRIHAVFCLAYFIIKQTHVNNLVARMYCRIALRFGG